MTLTACRVHARRDLSTGLPVAAAGLERIARLYPIEKNILGEPSATRQTVRWTQSVPLVFLHSGCLEIDSNFVEDRIRSVKLTAKNALFVIQ